MRVPLLAAALLLLTHTTEKPLLFEGTTRLSLGGGITFSPDGNTIYIAPPRNLGSLVNSAGTECCPSMSPDRRWLYFNGSPAGRPGIYRISVGSLPVLDEGEP